MPAPVYNVDGSTNQLKARALEQVLQLGLAGLGTGAALGGAQGLQNLFQRHTSKPPKIPNRTVVLPIQVPVRSVNDADGMKFADAEEPIDYEQRLLALRKRRGEDPGEQVEKTANPGRTLLSPVAEGIGNASGIFTPTANGAEYPRSSLGIGRLMGDNAESISDMPWFPAAALATIGGGLYGGYKGINALIGKARSNETQSELYAARDEYNAALANQYDKVASDGDTLDDVFDNMEKNANAINQGLGLMALMGTGLAAGSGVAAYNWVKDHSEAKALQDAVKQRNLELYSRSPRPVIAMPIPVEARPVKKKLLKAALAALRKVAAGSPTNKVRVKRPSASNAAQTTLQRLRQNKVLKEQQNALRAQMNGGGFSSADMGATA